jgi:hypothetical protein
MTTAITMAAATITVAAMTMAVAMIMVGRLQEATPRLGAEKIGTVVEEVVSQAVAAATLAEAVAAAAIPVAVAACPGTRLRHHSLSAIFPKHVANRLGLVVRPILAFQLSLNKFRAGDCELDV